MFGFVGFLRPMAFIGCLDIEFQGRRFRDFVLPTDLRSPRKTKYIGTKANPFGGVVPLHVDMSVFVSG